MVSPLLQAEAICCSRMSCDNVQVRLESLAFSCPPATLNLLLGNTLDSPNLFLRILGLLERPDSGEVLVNSAPTFHLGAGELAELRSHRFGYLFPEPFLLPSLSVCENVAMPLFKISGANIEDARQRTNALLEFVGLTDDQELHAAELSRFDQHRVALARALVHQPDLLMVEAPALPELELCELLKFIRKASSEFGVAAILSGMDERVASLMDCVLDMRQSSLAKTDP